MPKKPQTMYDLAPPGGSIETEIQINGRHVSRGTELSVRGIRGRVRFIRQVTSADGNVWIDAVAEDPRIRSFTADRVKRVHRIERTRENQEKTA